MEVVLQWSKKDVSNLEPVQILFPMIGDFFSRVAVEGIKLVPSLFVLVLPRLKYLAFGPKIA